jgi:hypothetical protein
LLLFILAITEPISVSQSDFTADRVVDVDAIDREQVILTMCVSTQIIGTYICAGVLHALVIGPAHLTELCDLRGDGAVLYGGRERGEHVTGIARQRFIGNLCLYSAGGHGSLKGVDKYCETYREFDEETKPYSAGVSA